MSIPSPSPERPAAPQADRSRSKVLAHGGAAPALTPVGPVPGPPGLGGLLMVVGGALCVAGGLFIALGAQALVTISPEAATMFLKGVPLVAGGGLVAIGASVRRALGRAYLHGVAAGRENLALPGAGAGAPQLPPERNEPRDR